MIYHLALEADWSQAQAGTGSYRISSIGRSLGEVGFISWTDSGPTAACYCIATVDVPLGTGASLQGERVRPTPTESMPFHSWNRSRRLYEALVERSRGRGVRRRVS